MTLLWQLNNYCIQTFLWFQGFDISGDFLTCPACLIYIHLVNFFAHSDIKIKQPSR